MARRRGRRASTRTPTPRCKHSQFSSTSFSLFSSFLFSFFFPFSFSLSFFPFFRAQFTSLHHYLSIIAAASTLRPHAHIAAGARPARTFFSLSRGFVRLS